jgi:hypothetical protein
MHVSFCFYAGVLYPRLCRRLYGGVSFAPNKKSLAIKPGEILYIQLFAAYDTP